LTLAVLAASSSFSLDEAVAAAQVLPPQAKDELKQRDQLWKKTQEFKAAGKLAEATASAKAMLAIERNVLPADHDDIVRSLNWLAQLHVEQEDFSSAEAMRAETLEILRKRYGEKHWKVTDARLALNDVESQARMTREQRQELAEADRLNREAIALHVAGKYGEATARARRALALRKAVLGERHPDYANSLNNLALLLKSQGDYATARPFYEQALAIMKEALGERHPDYARSQSNLAFLLQAQGDYAAARPLYEQTLAIVKEALGKRHPDYAKSLSNLAGLLVSQGDYAAARPLHEEALAIRKEALGERHPDYAASLNNLALLLKSQGDYAAARPLYEQALAIKKAVLGERHPAYATSLNNLAHLLNSEGDYAAARPLYEQALAIKKTVLGERHPAYATSLASLALFFESQGDYSAARPLCEQALAIRKEVLGERHPDYARSRSNLAELLRSQGDYAAARPLCEQALAIWKAVVGERHPDYARSLNNLALLLDSQGVYAAAQPLYEQALAIWNAVLNERHPYYATSLSNLGLITWAQGDLAPAGRLLTQALAITQRNVDLAAAGQSERQQLALAQAQRRRLDAYFSIGPVSKISPHDAYARLLGAKGAVFERQRRIRSLRARHRDDPEVASQTEEYARTVGELAVLALGAPDPKKPEEWKARIEVLSQCKDKLEAELSRQDAGFREAQEVASRTPEQLQRALPKDAALIDFLVYTAFQPPTNRKGKFQGEWRMLAFVVRSDRPVTQVDLGPVAPIQEAIDAWRSLLIKRETGDSATDRAQAVRRLIWEPVESHLDGITTVLISPDGPISLVPLAALPAKDPTGYLIEERSIAVVPVPRMLGMAAKTAARRQGTTEDDGASLLLAGDIDYGGEPGKARQGEVAMQRSAAISARAGLLADFAPLQATREEILAVRDSFERRFRKARVDVLREDEATEEAFRRGAPGHRYLHLATHGYFAPPELRSALAPADPKSASTRIDALGGAGVSGWHPGLLSGIALAGANIRPTPIGHDDGILTALEVAELDLSGVELAVLSACETGLGEVAGGEGLLGLQRAFQVAGADSVIASVWKVDDEPTRALMARFYENLWRKNQPPAQALREAQLSMLRGDLGRGSLTREPEKSRPGRLPPFYWAAFVLSTDRIPAPAEPPGAVRPVK
jgi:CHAT domain-containing protein/Tfp pilus assembly protein PilF